MRKWYALEADAGGEHTSSNVHGELELILEWCYNPALDFDRAAACGMRLDIAAGTAVRFEPGQRREVTLVPLSGGRRVFGFNQQIMGGL